MNFSFTTEQEDLKNKVIEFAQNHLNEGIVERDREGLFSKELWKTCADFGIQGLAAPLSLGGRLEEVELLTAVLAMEGFGYGCKDNGLSLALNAHMWTVQLPMIEFGNEEQKEKYIPKMVSGDLIAAHGLTEPNSGSDTFAMETTATKVDGGYVLNGKKHLITLAPLADIALIFASTNPKLGKWGISAFIVESNFEGFEALPVQAKMGLRTVPIGQFIFKDCFVPESNRLGKEGAGFGIISHSLEYDRCCILASHLGAMERQLEDSIAYIKERKQFGQKIGSFQSVSNRIADMKLRLETSRLLLYKTAWKKQSGSSAMMEASLLKLHLGESFVHSSLDAMRSMGGRSFLEENEIERDMRDSIGGLLYAGTSDIQRNIIARLLGL
ncbi:MAG: acyl-CoA dehydrogenase family protein [Bacteroidota bacterium]